MNQYSPTILKALITCAGLCVWLALPSCTRVEEKDPIAVEADSASSAPGASRLAPDSVSPTNATHPSALPIPESWSFDADDAKRRQRAAASTLGIPVEKTLPIAGQNHTFMLIPAGEFVMGSPENEPERERGETPFRVRITKPFYIGKFEVTQEQWEAVTGNNPSVNQAIKHPAEFIRYHDIGNHFLPKANEEVPDGLRLRLPSEAEWEYACRAGTDTAFNWGTSTITTEQANYYGDRGYNDGLKGENRRKTLAVGSFPANRWGLHDMHGNVHEFCRDLKSDYPSGAVSDPINTTEGMWQVIRGGSWKHWPGFSRSAQRGGSDQNIPSEYIGFRLVMEFQEK